MVKVISKMWILFEVSHLSVIKRQIIILDNFSPISIAPSVPSSMGSLKSPRCPIRNNFPLSLPKPLPSETLKFSSTTLRNLSASCPLGSKIAVNELLYSPGLSAFSSSSHALTAARAASASRPCLAHPGTHLALALASKASRGLPRWR